MMDPRTTTLADKDMVPHTDSQLKMMKFRRNNERWWMKAWIDMYGDGSGRPVIFHVDITRWSMVQHNIIKIFGLRHLGRIMGKLDLLFCNMTVETHGLSIGTVGTAIH